MVLAACERAGALALGPGLGRSDGAAGFARRLAREAPSRWFWMRTASTPTPAGSPRSPQGPRRTVLTPHAGELGRLLELDSAEIERERLLHAREAAQLASLRARPEGR